ncbi:MAG: helix-turn-helix domain-containing protein [Chitinivibrionales bacterium]|nr:helix-turn-helix domain-containing protein [Chitinivibrionales bacterium]
MLTFDEHLKEMLKDPEFKEAYEQELELLEFSIKLQKERKKAGLSQKELAEAAHLTQQQVSKVENGANCNIMTYLKASHAIGLRLRLSRPSRRAQLARA